MSSSQPSPPGTVRLEHMAVTQFVSVLLYTSVFVTIVVNADFAETGFAGIRRDRSTGRRLAHNPGRAGEADCDAAS